MSSLSLGYSPCPNDTFIFYGLVHGKLDGAPQVLQVLEDIETLNGMALEERLDLTKISFHAFGHLRETYCLLHAGGALGRGCGPLVVVPEGRRSEDLAGKRIAIPGKLTTAALLLRLYHPGLNDLHILPFNEIINAVSSGDVDAGVIIHEGRFTYPKYGLRQVIDLGAWWEQTTGHPIPLGGILARRSLGPEAIQRADQALKDSITYAKSNPDAVLDYILQHAQEMDEQVVREYIDLYVNRYTEDYGPDGEAAINDLIIRAQAADILPKSSSPLFIDG